MPEEKGSPTDRVVKEGFMEEGDLLLDLEKRISFCKSEREKYRASRKEKFQTLKQCSWNLSFAYHTSMMYYYLLNNFLKSTHIWDFPGSPVVKTVIPLQGASVLSVMRELRSHMLHGADKRRKEEKFKINTHLNILFLNLIPFKY